MHCRGLSENVAGRLAIRRALQRRGRRTRGGPPLDGGSAKQTTNPIRLLMLVRKIHEVARESARPRARQRRSASRPGALLRDAPRIAGGDVNEARAQAAAIARRDIPSGISRAATSPIAKTSTVPPVASCARRCGAAAAPTRALAVKWLGWLSQETQQWDDAFAMFDELRATDPSALYEIGRTAVFCSCRVEQGRAALQEYLKAKRRRTCRRWKTRGSN